MSGHVVIGSGKDTLPPQAEQHLKRFSYITTETWNDSTSETALDEALSDEAVSVISSLEIAVAAEGDELRCELDPAAEVDSLFTINRHKSETLLSAKELFEQEQEQAIETATESNSGTGETNCEFLVWADESPDYEPSASAPKPFWSIWWLEILCIVSGFSTLTLILFVLAAHDEKPLPEWPLGITLNTFLAFCTAICKASLMIPVCLAISQTQWTWFQKERPLYDFHIIDQASRGSWGSMLLIWRFGFRHLITLGAFLTVASVVTTPLTQLAISYPTRNVVLPEEEARTWALLELSGRIGRNNLNGAAHRAVLATTAAADDTNFTEPTPTTGAICSTGDCTFETYKSLGVCLKIANITSHLEVKRYNLPQGKTLESSSWSELSYYNSTVTENEYDWRLWSASLPGGYSLVHQSNVAILSDRLNGRETFGFAEDPTLIQTRLSSFILIYTSMNLDEDVEECQSQSILARPPCDSERYQSPARCNWQSIVPVAPCVPIWHEAMEVLFYPCVQEHKTKVTLGVENALVSESPSEVILRDEDDFLDMNCSLATSREEGTCHAASYSQKGQDNAFYLQVPFDKSFPGPEALDRRGLTRVEYESLSILAKAMYHELVGWVVPGLTDADLGTLGAARNSGGGFIISLFYNVLYSSSLRNHTRRHESLTNLYSNVATTMSSLLRSASPQLHLKEVPEIIGEARKEMVYVHISWHWITFLAIQLVLAAVFLALTIGTLCEYELIQAAQGKSPLPRNIKDSPLAVLVALSKLSREAAGGGLAPMEELERVSKKLRVRFEGSEVVLVKDEEEHIDGHKDQEKLGRRWHWSK
ncbi:hypothetical protein CTRI78_v006863 [Colletotrichum trifolii]|uniref:Uncharacterized protein n=1 Tax=Colletotrichum trifolii TaxID=5466 RepID=A0A4R8RB50_COLTR|nr:hypothetical protein CTRI78_v006863 [Colletotrichum trifolii]